MTQNTKQLLLSKRPMKQEIRYHRIMCGHLLLNHLKLQNLRSADINDIKTNVNQPVQITLKGTGPAGKTLEYFAVLPPIKLGTVSGYPSATVTYTPKAGYSGEDSFQDCVRSGTETSEPATVRIKVEEAGSSYFSICGYLAICYCEKRAR